MTYHWEFISPDWSVLFEEGTSWTGSLPAPGAVAAINKRPGAGERRTTYSVSGALIMGPQDYWSFVEAVHAIEAVAKGSGGTIKGA